MDVGGLVSVVVFCIRLRRIHGLKTCAAGRGEEASLTGGTPVPLMSMLHWYGSRMILSVVEGRRLRPTSGTRFCFVLCLFHCSFYFKASQ